MAVAPRPEREPVIIINFLCHQSITQTNTLKNCMPTIAAFTPLSRGRRILAAAPRSDMIYLIF